MWRVTSGECVRSPRTRRCRSRLQDSSGVTAIDFEVAGVRPRIVILVFLFFCFFVVFVFFLSILDWLDLVTF